MFDFLKRAWSVVGGGSPDHVEPWMIDEFEFESHFGRSHEEFAERLVTLDAAHSKMYDETARVNAEAAVAWVFFITG